MKNLILICISLALMGCNKYALRTGTVCVQPLDISNYSTSDPLLVKEETVSYIKKQLLKYIVKKIDTDTKMTLENDCTKSSYSLEITFDKIDAITAVVGFKEYIGGGRTTHRYKVSVTGLLVKNEPKEKLVDFEASAHDDKLDDQIENIANDIVSAITKDKKILLR